MAALCVSRWSAIACNRSPNKVFLIRKGSRPFVPRVGRQSGSKFGMTKKKSLTAAGLLMEVAVHALGTNDVGLPLRAWGSGWRSEYTAAKRLVLQYTALAERKPVRCTVACANSRPRIWPVAIKFDIGCTSCRSMNRFNCRAPIDTKTVFPS
jgi:hypothetical protein